MSDRLTIRFDNNEEILEMNEIIRFNLGGVELALNKDNGILQLLDKDKKVLSQVDFPTERIIKNISYNEETQSLVFEFDNYPNVEVPLVLSNFATKEFVENKIFELINGSPEALDTLKELADALGNDENFATTVLNKLGEKVDKEYVDEKILKLPSTSYQSIVNGGTYPRLMKYDNETLYLFTDNAYSVSKDCGKTWSERVVICSTELDSTSDNPVNDVANAFGILSPNNDGRVIVFYRATNRDNLYFSIRCRVSDTTGHNFGDYKVLKTNDTGTWEPFYYEGYLYYSWEHERLGAQSQYRSKITVQGDNVTVSSGIMAIDGRNSQNIDGNTINTSRVGMLSISPLKSGGHIYVYENTVNKNASVPRPMVVQYAYGKNPETNTIGLTKMGTLFMGDEGITCGAPYVTTLDDGRVVISFQTDQHFEGVTPENNLHKKQVVVYVSKREVKYGDELTADDFVRIYNYAYGENDYSVWGSVLNIDGQLYNTFTLGKNKNETEQLFVTNIVKVLNTNIVENVNIKPEQVMEIIEENSEEVDALSIGVSTSYDMESDEQIPTSKAVADYVSKNSSNSSTKSYNLPLGEASWLRIAHVKDIANNSSGMFTFDCYGVKPDGNKEILTTSVFNVSCGLDGSGKFISDVLPITQAPELTSSDTSGGGSGAPSGSGDTGSGTTGAHGLASIKIERFEEDVYVCGLLNYPATEQYTSLSVEMKIENNLNFETLEQLEVVNLDEIIYGADQVVSEGTILEANKDYEFKIRCTLADYMNGLNQGLEQHIFFNGRNSGNNLLYYEDGVLFINNGNKALSIGSDYPNDFFNLELLSTTISYLGDGTHVLKAWNKNFTNYQFSSSNYGLGRFVKISGKITMDAVTNGGDGGLTLNKEVVLEVHGELKEYHFENLTPNDVLAIGGSSEIITTADLDLENTIIEIAIPFSDKALNISSIEIANNDVYNMSLLLNSVTKHYTSDSYDLFSSYNRFDSIENTLSKKINSLDTKYEQRVHEKMSLIEVATYYSSNGYYSSIIKGLYKSSEKILAGNSVDIDRQLFVFSNGYASANLFIRNYKKRNINYEYHTGKYNAEFYCNFIDIKYLKIITVDIFLESDTEEELVEIVDNLFDTMGDLTPYFTETPLSTPIDTEMSDTSENPVQNKVVKKYVDESTNMQQFIVKPEEDDENFFYTYYDFNTLKPFKIKFKGFSEIIVYVENKYDGEFDVHVYETASNEFISTNKLPNGYGLNTFEVDCSGVMISLSKQKLEYILGEIPNAEDLTLTITAYKDDGCCWGYAFIDTINEE